jgi:hypothetical protein
MPPLRGPGHIVQSRGMPESPVPPSLAAFLPADLPSPLKALAGIAVTMAHDIQHLPERAVQFPASMLTHLAAKSLKVQQQYAEWVTRGEQFLGSLQEPSEEIPPWATFDEDLPAPDPGSEDDVPAPLGLGPGSAFDLQADDELPVARHRKSDAAWHSPSNTNPIDSAAQVEPEGAGAPPMTVAEAAEAIAASAEPITASEEAIAGSAETIAGSAETVKKDRTAKTPAKKASPAKKSTPAKKASPAKKSTPAKKATATSTKQSAAAKKSSPAKKTAARNAAGPNGPANGPVNATTADAIRLDQESSPVTAELTDASATQQELPTAEASTSTIAAPPAGIVSAGPGTVSTGPEPGSPAVDASAAGDALSVEPTTAAGPASSDADQASPVAPQSLPDFDTLTIPQLRTRLKTLRTPELNELIEYEHAGRNRPAIVGMLRARLDTLQK